MEPTFQNGDVLLLKKWGVPKKDDIIIAYIEELDLMTLISSFVIWMNRAEA